MKHEKAYRKYRDEDYGLYGFWYYHWPHIGTVFKADRQLTFNPIDETQELTIDEYIDLSIKRNTNHEDTLQ